MFQNLMSLTSFNNWQTGWVMRAAESCYGRPLTGLKRNLLYSIFSGVIAGVIFALVAFFISIFFIDHNDTSEILLLSGLVAVDFTAFVFLVSMFLTKADDIKRKMVNSGKHGLVLRLLFNSATLIILFIISVLFFSYFTPSKYFTATELTPLACPDGKCDVPTTRPDPTLPTVEEIAERKESAIEQVQEKKNPYADIDFASLSIDEFDEFLDNSGFHAFDIKVTEEIATSTFADISLFNDQKDVDWRQFLAELDDIAINSPHHVDIKIYSAIMKEAPFEVINDILNRGHELDGNHITELTKYFTVEEFQQLENYGIDLSAQSSTGAGVLSMSLLSKQGPELFEYFLTKDKLVMAEDINVVKEVLMLSSKLNRSIQYTQQLIDRGAPITDETKEWIETDLRENNRLYYVIVKSQLHF